MELLKTEFVRYVQYIQRGLTGIWATQVHSDASQLTVNEATAASTTPGGSSDATQLVAQSASNAAVTVQATLQSYLPNEPHPCAKFQNCLRWLLDNVFLQPKLWKLHKQMWVMISQLNPPKKTVRAVATALDINSRTFRQSQLRAQVELLKTEFVRYVHRNIRSRQIVEGGAPAEVVANFKRLFRSKIITTKRVAKELRELACSRVSGPSEACCLYCG